MFFYGGGGGFRIINYYITLHLLRVYELHIEESVVFQGELYSMWLLYFYI